MCVCPTAVERKLHLGIPKEVWKDQDIYIKKEHSGGVNDLFVLLQSGKFPNIVLPKIA